MLETTNRLNNSWSGTPEPIFLVSLQFYQTLPLYQEPLISINYSNDSLARILENSRLYTTVDLGSHSTQNDALSKHYSCDAISYSESSHNRDKQSSPNPENKDSESIKYLSEESLDYIYRESNDKTMIIVQSISVAATNNDGVQNNLQDDGAQNNSRDEAIGSIEISTKPELCDNIANSETQEPSASPLLLMTPVSNFGPYRVTSQIVVDGHNFENENMVDGGNDMPNNNPCRKIINFCSKIFQCFGRQ